MRVRGFRAVPVGPCRAEPTDRVRPETSAGTVPRRRDRRAAARLRPNGVVHAGRVVRVRRHGAEPAAGRTVFRRLFALRQPVRALPPTGRPATAAPRPRRRRNVRRVRGKAAPVAPDSRGRGPFQAGTLRFEQVAAERVQRPHA